jgi:DNA sulfur modification protein DndC
MLGEILRIQDEVNAAAVNCGQPTVNCLINDEELARIRELIAAKTWPEKWDGTEHRGR